jgi:hypothetical protein
MRIAALKAIGGERFMSKRSEMQACSRGYFGGARLLGPWQRRHDRCNRGVNKIYLQQ